MKRERIDKTITDGVDRIRIVSDILGRIDNDGYLNVVADGSRDGSVVITLTPEKAKELRNTLIDAYPMNVASEKQAYEVEAVPAWMAARQDGLEFRVVQGRAVPTKVNIAYADTKEEAQKIAQALNEAEGL